ncbi:trypsin-like serine protease [Basidiobolus meristosporus CBS 931.73]|uniref:Trypsin-like serine protease n=1 Tax=Basidiobolus meristosporus CBS 931.73 TaxID=1314790 RepID=A0A1Y1Y8K9_9FUNG|nr:trypsin-like serine protease [Basidiobolus meristosporus CBS 931.73]|eukprot:ORX94352.1 trypsin-like serine protease [Basidiobolus meristosporus CBS 931.73]
MAFTYLQNPAIGEMRWCGGVVLDSTTILSAAHCFHEKPVGEILVHLLRHNLKVKAEEEGGLVVPAVNITIHPDWDRNRAINDFAILKLAHPLPSQITFLPIQQAKQPIPNRAHVKALGWGLTSATQYPDILQEIEMSVLDEKLCIQKYSSLNIPFNPTAVLCVGTEQGVRNVCSGDSGGPLVSFDGAGNPWLIGITSYSAGCGIDVPAAFARVAAQANWINRYVDPPKPKKPRCTRTRNTNSTRRHNRGSFSQVNKHEVYSK